MEPPTVSVICPSYNHGRFLAEALRSLQAQTFPDWEAIILDDGSSDNSLVIAREIASGDPRFTVEANPRNLGTYATLERARNMAKGAYIAVLNSDDFWAPTRLEKQLEVMAQHRKAAFCYTLGWKVNEEGVVDQREDVHGDWPQSEVQDLTNFLTQENRVLASSVLFRAEGLRFLPQMRYSGDWVVLLRDPRAVLVPERLTYWRMHSHNTFVRTPGQVLEEISVREAICQVGEKEPRLRRAGAKGLAINRFHLSALEVLRGDRAGGVRDGLRALALWPSGRTIKRAVRLLQPSARARLWPDEPPLDFRQAATPPSPQVIGDYLREGSWWRS